MSISEKLDFIEQKFNILAGHKDTVTCLDYSYSRLFIASGSFDGTIKLWNIKRNIIEFTLNSTFGSVWSLIFTNNDTYLISGMMEKNIVVWDLNTRTIFKILSQHDGCVNALAISANTFLISGSDDNSICVWRMNSFELLNVYKAHTNYITCVCADSNGGNFASASADKSVIYWEIHEANKFTVYKKHTGIVNNVLFIDDSKYLASCSDDGTVNVLNLKTQQSILFTIYTQVIEMFPRVSGIKNIFYDEINKYIICYSNKGEWKTAKSDCWKSAKDIQINDFSCPLKSEYAGIKYTENIILLGKNNGTVYIYDFKTGEILNKFNSVNELKSISLNNNTNFSAFLYNDCSVQILNLKLKQYLLNTNFHNFKPGSISFTKSSKYVALSFLPESSKNLSVLVIKIPK